MRQGISLEEAQEILLQRCIAMEAENLALAEAFGRTLSADITASENVPPFARSPYDGYAMRSADLQQASSEHPVVLRVLEEIPAGYAPKYPLTEGTVTQVFTGAPLPEGADCVTKYEDVRRERDRISVFGSMKAGENVVPAGEDVQMGQMVAPKGLVVNGPVMGLLASLGVARVPVYRQPRIAIISTGDELVGVEDALTPGKIRNSNSFALMGYIRSLRAEPLFIGTSLDRTKEVASLLEKGLAEADMVLTTGGVSVGDYDVVKDAVKEVGAESLFWKIKTKPGSPTLAAVRDGKIIIGLSGNPAAAMVVFLLLAAPCIKKLAGNSDYYYKQVSVLLEKNFRKSSPTRRFLRGKLTYKNGLTYFDSTGEQNNDVMSSLIYCDALAEIPEGSGPLQAGDKLTAYLI